MQLADLGAEVIKIEDPSVGGDVSPLRAAVPAKAPTRSSSRASTGTSDRVTLDLRHPEARRVLEDLVRDSDALVSNLRGDQPDRLRLRFADLEHVNPRLVCVSLSGFGMTGPRAGEGGYDYTVQGLTGWMQLTGGPDQPPTKSGLSLVDFGGGYVAAIATLAGVWQARRDGRGCDADLSLFETALAQLTYIGDLGGLPRTSSRGGCRTPPIRRWCPSRRSRRRTGGSWSRARSRSSGSASATRSVRPS